LPPVERLCAPISGTNVTQLADCLGLDTSKYRVSTASGDVQAEAEIQPLESQIPDAVRFKDSSPLLLRCRFCKSISSYRGISPSIDASEEDEAVVAAPVVVSVDGFTCPSESCGKIMGGLSVAAQLESQIRQHVARYYTGWLACDDSTCDQRTRQISVYGHRCLGPKGLGSGCQGKMQYEYTEKMLYNQLLYLSTMFDVERIKDRVGAGAGAGAAAAAAADDEESKGKVNVLVECNRQRFDTAREVVRGYLDRNGRQWVQMDSLFAFALQP
jgi:DNA polymerase alpha subunit A